MLVQCVSFKFVYIAVEVSLLFADGDMIIFLTCGERDSRDRCLRDKSRVEVLARNTSLSSDVETKLTSLHLGTCILPSDIQHLVRAYTSALQNSECVIL